MWRAHQLVYGCDESSTYHKRSYTQHYEKHNADVHDYFRHRSQDLLVLNLSEPDAMQRLCAFLEWAGADSTPASNRSSSRLAGTNASR